MKSCKKQFGGEEKWIALFRFIRRKNVAILLIHFELLTNVRINTWQHEVWVKVKMQRIKIRQQAGNDDSDGAAASKFCQMRTKSNPNPNRDSNGNELYHVKPNHITRKRCSANFQFQFRRRKVIARKLSSVKLLTITITLITFYKIQLILPKMCRIG